MQTIICSLIIVAAVLYVAKRWLPASLKRRLMPGKTPLAQQSAQLTTQGSCSSCSSCGNCGSDSIKLAKK